MRLIDAYALLMYLADIKLGESPTGFEPSEERKTRWTICEGLQMAEEAVEDSPTVLIETDLDETEQKILRKFRELREIGRKNQHIYSPTAWALYWTWNGLEMWSNMIDRKEADHEQTDTAQSVQGRS